MADITKCSQNGCPMADTCYRVKAEDNPFWQSWTNYEYTCNEGDGFSMYIKNNKTK